METKKYLRGNLNSKIEMLSSSLGDSTRKFPSIYLKNSDLKYTRLTNDFILIQRNLKLDQSKVIHDVFGSGWVFISGELKEGQVSLKLASGEYVNLPEGIFSAYFPAYSVVEWHLSPGEFQLEMVTCFQEKSLLSTESPVFWRQLARGNIVDHLKNTLIDGLPEDTLNIDRVCRKCHLSARAFEFIKANHHESFTIQSLAKKLNTSPSVLSRYFKKSYGMSPIELLNQLRVMNSLGTLLVDEKRVVDIAIDAGFSNVRVYNEHFSKIMGDVPSAFFKRQLSTL